MSTIKGEMTQAKVLKVATHLINKKGFKNTSINEIIRATGVKKGNLYFHFPSKEHIGLAILREVEADFFQFLLGNLRGKGPLEKLSSFFDAVLEKHKKTKFIGGCIVGNFALEMSDSNPQFSNAVEEIFSKWGTVLTGLLIEARESGELITDISPRVLAKHIVATIEGAIMMARVSKSERDLKDCLNSLRALLGIKEKGK